MFGISYPGFYTAMGMIDSHPALKAASPQAPIADWFMGDDLHHNGAFFLSQNFGFFYFVRAEGRRSAARGLEALQLQDARRLRLLPAHGAARATPTSCCSRAASPEWNEFLAHPTYDAYWQARNIRPHLKNVRCAVMTVGGWYDAEDLVRRRWRPIAGPSGRIPASPTCS